MEFLEEFSLILVGNQGGYDLHLLRLVNMIDERDGSSKYKLVREYVFKGSSIGTRILGVSTQGKGTSTNRVYVLTSDRRLNVIEINRSDMYKVNTLLI